MKITQILQLFFLCTFMASCATTYTPSENVKAMTSRMTEQEAMTILQKMMTVRDQNGKMTNLILTGYWGLCNSNGFAIEATGGAGVQVTRDGFSVSAYKRGDFVKSDGSMNYYEKIPYREDLRFANMRSIKIGEPGLMTETCARRDGQSQVVIRETFVRWYALLIPTSEKEQFIAAMLRLNPDANIEE